MVFSPNRKGETKRISIMEIMYIPYGYRLFRKKIREKKFLTVHSASRGRKVQGLQEFLKKSM